MASTIKNKEKASIIIEFNSGEVVYEENADKRVQVASIVKLMTTLLTIEELEKGNVKFEAIVNDSQIPGLPLPGTYQYGRPVTVINKEDFE